MEYSELATNNRKSLHLLMDLLGWVYSSEPHKNLPFEPGYNALGATYDLSQSLGGHFLVKNKEGRVDDMMGMIETCLKRGCMHEGELSVIRGRLQFAEGQMFDRSSRVIMGLLANQT